MRFVTFSSAGSAARLGLLEPAERVLDLTTAGAGEPALASLSALLAAGDAGLTVARECRDGATARARHALADVRLHAPIPRPTKNVFCVGLNYRSHVEQNAAALGLPADIPDIPLFFSKPTTSVVGPGEEIRLDPRLTTKLDYEIELTLVIGRGGSWIPERQAMDHVFGYTIANDVSARDLQWRTSQFFYGKGQDTYCPVGPAVTTRDELPDLAEVTLELLVNGEMRQRESAGNMLFSPARVVAELSRGITLEAGDLITLGTPGGCGYQLTPPVFLDDGDVVQCRATGIGTLSNPVRAVLADTSAGDAR